MNANVVERMWAWRTWLWVGVIGSLLAWAWVWYMGRGPSVVMLLVAMSAVALAFRATAGMRMALAGLMVCGLAMFLASLYWLALLMMAGGQVTAQDVLTTSVFPMVAAMVLLLGSVSGFRHAKAVQTPPAAA